MGHHETGMDSTPTSQSSTATPEIPEFRSALARQITERATPARLALLASLPDLQDPDTAFLVGL